MPIFVYLGMSKRRPTRFEQ